LCSKHATEVIRSDTNVTVEERLQEHPQQLAQRGGEELALRACVSVCAYVSVCVCVSVCLCVSVCVSLRRGVDEELTFSESVCVCVCVYLELSRDVSVHTIHTLVPVVLEVVLLELRRVRHHQRPVGEERVVHVHLLLLEKQVVGHLVDSQCEAVVASATDDIGDGEELEPACRRQSTVQLRLE
jgi:hypothetical protein